MIVLVKYYDDYEDMNGKMQHSICIDGIIVQGSSEPETDFITRCNNYCNSYLGYFWEEIKELDT